MLFSNIIVSENLICIDYTPSGQGMSQAGMHDVCLWTTIICIFFLGQYDLVMGINNYKVHFK